MLGWLTALCFWRRREVALAPPAGLAPLERIILADGVARTLFEDYGEHYRSLRGDEEIGWVLMGLRQGSEAIAMAALPAGAERDAGAAHIRFNAAAQALASRLVRQKDKRLQILGVVHTHPGSFRIPSDGDLHGDRHWVRQLRGGDGVFAIGTADARAGESTGAHLQVQGELCFSWYALAAGAERYRRLPVQVTLGSDLALPARSVWDTIEAQAGAIDHLCRQLAHVHLNVIEDDPENLLCVRIDLAAPQQQLRLLLSTTEARYYWDRDGQVIAIDPHEPNLLRAVYLILADLTKESERMLVES